MILYEAYNKTNGKVYVGLTTKSLKHRKAQHIRSSKSGSNSHFHKAIRKYGPDSFEWNVVMSCGKLKELYEKEKLLISLYEPWQLYNKSLGGEHSAYGMRHTEETKSICGEFARQRWNGKRYYDKYPAWLFRVCSYKVAKKFDVPKTTWYRHRVSSVYPRGKQVAT